MPVCGEVREVDYNDGMVTVWLCAVNGVPVLLTVPIPGFEVVDYDTEGDDAYLSDYDSE